MSSLRKKRRKLLRWERWEGSRERVVPNLKATRGSIRAWNAVAREENRRMWLKWRGVEW